MRPRAHMLARLLATTCSLAVFVCAALLWNRSLSLADYYYRLGPTPTGGSALRGFGSYRGALVIGTIENTTPAGTTGQSPYRHDTFPISKGGGGSMMRAEPDTKVAALGFGVSRGELKLTLPIPLPLPRQTYRAVYIPYYFIMLLAIIQPIRLTRRLLRARRTDRVKPDHPPHAALTAALLAVTFAPLAGAEQATSRPAATQPIDTAALIRQLGDDDVKQRNAAGVALRKIGKDALPALKAATTDPDPEIATRAQALIASIEGREKVAGDVTVPSPGGLLPPHGNIRIAPGGMLQIQGAAQLRISVSNNNGVATRDVVATQNGRTTHLREDPDGITVDVTENGETKQSKAKTPAELKEKDPDAYKVYEQLTRIGGPGANVRLEPAR